MANLRGTPATGSTGAAPANSFVIGPLPAGIVEGDWIIVLVRDTPQPAPAGDALVRPGLMQGVGTVQAPTVSGGGSVQLIAGNLLSLQDQSLESAGLGAGSWTAVWNGNAPARVTSNYADGGAALACTATGPGAYFRTQQYACQPGTTYTLTAKSRANAGQGGQVGIYAEWWDSGHNWLGSSSPVAVANDTDAGETALTTDVTSPVNGVYVTFDLYIGLPGTHDFDSMSCVLKAAGGVTLVAGNVLSLQDQSFEAAGTGTWAVDQGSGVVTRVGSPVKDGAGALQFTPAVGGSTIATGKYAVNANTTYGLSVWARAVAALTSITVNIQWYDAGDGWLSNTGPSITPLTTGFVEFPYSATSPPTAAKAVVYVYVQDAQALVIDRIVLAPTGGGGGGGGTDLDLMVYDQFGLSTDVPGVGPHTLRTDIDSLPASGGGILGRPDYLWAGHEDRPWINAGYDFYQGARQFGAAPWLPPYVGGGAPWGYYALRGEALAATSDSWTPLTDNSGVRIHLYQWQCWLLAADGGTWYLHTSAPGLQGGNYDHDFNPTTGPDRNFRDEAGGGWSTNFIPGYICHWWQAGDWPRITFPATIWGIHTRVQIRMIPDNGGDVSGKRIIAESSLDFYDGPYAEGTKIPGMMMGRYRRLTTSFQWFTSTNLSQAQMRRNPPPGFGA